MIDYQVVKNWRFEEARHHYTERDTILYALSVGFGGDPLDDVEKGTGGLHHHHVGALVDVEQYLADGLIRVC